MDFSILICTFNPDKRLLKRCLDAVSALDRTGIRFECIVVDNNSDVPVNLNDYKIKGDEFRIIREPVPGLSNARISGVKNSRAPLIVFADDDNELDPAYLVNAKQLLEQHPDLAALGAGKITVDYIDGAPAWMRKHFSQYFQEKNLSSFQTGNEVGWPAYYPVGSGLVVKREIMHEYIRLYENQKITASDRKGTELSSGGDSQIVWTAIKSGAKAGSSPLLALTHIIPAKRISIGYLAKLNYGISKSYHSGLPEMFPGFKFEFKKRNLLSKLSLFIRTLTKSKFNPVLGARLYKVENAWYQAYDDLQTLEKS